MAISQELLEILALDDHHLYTVEDWRRIANRTRQLDLVLTTEKDLVKLEGFPFARRKLVALRVVPEIEGGDELLRLVLARTGLAPDGASAGGLHGDQ